MESAMTKVHYEIIEHDAGWAYKVNDTISETYATHDAAKAAASRAAGEQKIPGETGDIIYQDASGEVREESTQASDRPETDVKG
jgi:hypothetical protein